MIPNKDKAYYDLFIEHKIEIIDNFDTGHNRMRFSYPDLLKYANSASRDKVCALVGIRRTGKTTEMMQCASELEKNGKRVLFLSISQPPEVNLKSHPEKLVQISELYEIIKDAQSDGYNIVFIDEITYVNDFLYANSLANVYARKTPIIIAGTDSLGIEIAEKDALYDRMIKIPTSYVSFEEFKYLRPQNNLDDYIAYGGTLHDESPYKKIQDARNFLNTAIAENIIHALRFEAIEKDYDLLTDIYKENELKSAIQKLANKAGQNVAIRAIRKEYESAPIRTAFRNISKSENEDLFDLALAKKSDSIKKIEKELRDLFDIKLNSELNSEFLNKHFDELEYYLFEIGILKQIPIYPNLKGDLNCRAEYKDIILQPGMLYCHAKAALDILTLNESAFKEWNIKDKTKFNDRIDRQTKGDILEMLILYDTFCSFPQIKNIHDSSNYYVSKLRLENVFYNNVSLDGKEIDVIIRTPEKNIYLLEVKYSEEKIVDQTTNLTNATLGDYIERNFDGKIIGRAVIYNGNTELTDEIKYINASEYLTSVRHVDKFDELFSSKILKNLSQSGDDGDQGVSGAFSINNTKKEDSSGSKNLSPKTNSIQLGNNQRKSDSSTNSADNHVKAQTFSVEDSSINDEKDLSDDFER